MIGSPASSCKQWLQRIPNDGLKAVSLIISASKRRQQRPSLCAGNPKMTMRIATAAWADPAEVEERYPYRDGTVWLGRSGSEGRIPLGYLDDRHVCLVGGSRGGKGTTSIIPALVTRSEEHT